MKRKVHIEISIDFDDDNVPQHPSYWDWTTLINQQGITATVVRAEEQPVEQPEIQMLGAAEIFSILYGADHLEEPTRSIHPLDRPIQRVHVLPHSVGAYLAELDPNEKYFHVELRPPKFAELWSARAWKDSLTRRLRHMPTQYDNSHVALRQAVLSELITIIAKASHKPFVACQQTAAAILAYPEQYDVMLDLLQLSPELRSKLKQLQTSNE